MITHFLFKTSAAGVLVAALLAACAAPAVPPRPAPSETFPAPAIITPPPEPTALPTTPGDFLTGRLGALSLAEFRVARQGEDKPERFEFRQRIPTALLAQRAGLRIYPLQRTLAEANPLLERFGWQIKSEPLSPASVRPYDLRLLQDGKEVKTLENAWPISVSASGKEFAMLVEQSGGKYASYVLTRLGLVPWDSMLHAYTRPVYAGEALVTVERLAAPGQYVVKQDGRPVYTYSGAEMMVDEPVKGLWIWQGQWLLEVRGEVIVNGRSLNRQLGYDEIFNWHLLNGRPFYFFSQGGKVGISYDGLAYPGLYDEVIHYRCCEPAAFNFSSSGQLTWFYALRDGWWVYAESW